VADEVFPHLGHCPISATAPPAFVVLLVAEPFRVDSSGCMPELQSVEPGRQRVQACHPNRSLGFCLPLSL